MSQYYHLNTAAARQRRSLNRTSSMQPEPAVAQLVAQQILHHEHFRHLGLATYVLKEYCGKLQKENTWLVYEPKQKEYKAYCDIVCAREPDHCRQTVTHDKIYDFMLYVSFRPKKRQGKRKHGEPVPPLFDHELYKNVKEMIKDGSYENVKNPIGYQVFQTYKSAIWNLWDEQVGANSNAIDNWLRIWQADCRALAKIVKARKKVKAKEDHEEKMDNHFTFFKAHDKDKMIENEMWLEGQNQNQLRNALDKLK